jgi:hypothetical protein
MKNFLVSLYLISLCCTCAILFGLSYDVNSRIITLSLTSSPVVKYSSVARKNSFQQGNPMHSIVFNFQPQISLEEQDALLAEINGWDEISKAARLKPESKNPVLLGMCYVYVNNSVELEIIVKRLSAFPEIESASIPAERQIL